MEQRLNRTLGLVAIIAFGFTNEIAAGLFFVSTQIQQSSPGVGSLVPLLMIVGGIITFITVVAYRFFFASGLVGAGGEYVIISRSVSPGIAFVATFLAWFGLTGSLGTLAYSAPHFLATAATSMGAGGLGTFLSSSIGILVAGLVIHWGFWLLPVCGVRLAGILAIVAMGLVLVVSILMIVYGFATSPQAFNVSLTAHLHKSISSIISAAPVQHVRFGTAFGSALPVLFFGYLGLSTATQTGGEAKDARKSLVKAVLLTVSLVTVVYTVFSLAIYHAVPWRVIAGLAHMKLSAYTTSSGLLQFIMPSWLASLINLCVALIVMKTFLPIFLAQSRWVFAWSEDGLIPKVFAKTHAKYKTPVLALTVSALFGSISLIESMQLGYVFGVNVRVLSVMVVFFFMGIGMLVFPKHAPHLYASNESFIAKSRTLQIAVGILLMGIAIWFSISISLSSLKGPLLLPPFVTSAIVAIIAIVNFQNYKMKLRNTSDFSGAARQAEERFKQIPLQ